MLRYTKTPVRFLVLQTQFGKHLEGTFITEDDIEEAGWEPDDVVERKFVAPVDSQNQVIAYRVSTEADEALEDMEALLAKQREEDRVTIKEELRQELNLELQGIAAGVKKVAEAQLTPSASLTDDSDFQQLQETVTSLQSRVGELVNQQTPEQPAQDAEKIAGLEAKVVELEGKASKADQLEAKNTELEATLKTVLERLEKLEKTPKTGK